LPWRGSWPGNGTTTAVGRFAEHRSCGPEEDQAVISNPVDLEPRPKAVVDVEDTTVPGGPSGQVSVRILRPQGARRPLAVIVHIHGAG
jgi:acetyl esterase/lipase